MGTTDNMTEKEMTEEIKESRMTVRMTKEALYDSFCFMRIRNSVDFW